MSPILSSRFRSTFVLFATGVVVALVAAQSPARLRALPTAANSGSAALPGEGDGCTIISAGRLATVDGSVINSQSDACSECRIHVVPGQAHPPGSKAPVHWGLIYYGRDDERGGRPVGDYGAVIGEVPQVARTYTYFHTGYSLINEHQVAIAESTCSQKRALDVPYIEGVTEQIMTVD
jgi:hypothetical protein